MIYKNKYIKYSKISEEQFRLFLRYFSEDLSATQISNLLGISRNSINRHILSLRKLISNYDLTNGYTALQNNHYILPEGVADGDDLFVGVRLVDKVIYTEFLTSGNELFRGITNEEESVSDLGYDMVVNFINKGQTVINPRIDKIDLMRGFLSFVRYRLTRLNGLDKRYFGLHIKESEFRFNYRDMDIYKLLLKLVRQNPI